MKRQRLFCVALLAIVVAIPWFGCGARDDRSAVRGKVTLDGSPLDSGAISFMPVDGKGATGGAKIVNGEYEAKVPPGDKTVSIMAEKVVGKERRDPNDPDSETYEVSKQYLPEKYNSETTLKATVTQDESRADFDLKSK